MRLEESGNSNSKSNAMLTKPRLKVAPKHRSRGFVVCIKNEGYEVSLEPRKLYQVLADADAERHHQIRIVDESGEDYLYPSRFFATIELPQAVRKAVLQAV